MALFGKTLETVITVAVLIAIGYLAIDRGWLSEDAAGYLPKYLIWIAVPCTIIQHMDGIEQPLYALKGIFLACAVQILCLYIGLLAAKLLKISRRRRGVFACCFAYCNAGFVGLPIVNMLFGNSAVSPALYFIIADHLAFWTFGAYQIRKDAVFMGTSQEDANHFWVKIINPPLVVFAVMTVWAFLPWQLPNVIIQPVKLLDATTSPLALLFCGTILGGIGLKNVRWKRGFSAILAGRFVVCPMLLGILFLGFPMGELTEKVMLIQSAMPVLTMAELAAKQSHADVEYVTQAFMFSVLALLFALPAVYYVVMR